MSSISNAYKLQIEKLTNKINRLILENRKLNNFICEGDDTTGGSGTGGSGTGGSGTSRPSGPPSWTPTSIPGMKPGWENNPYYRPGLGANPMRPTDRGPSLSDYYDPNNPDWFKDYMQALINYFRFRWQGTSPWWKMWGHNFTNQPYLPTSTDHQNGPVFGNPNGLIPFTPAWWEWWNSTGQNSYQLNPSWLQELFRRYPGNWQVNSNGMPIFTPPPEWGPPDIDPNGNNGVAGPDWNPHPNDFRRYYFNETTQRWYFQNWQLFS